MINILDAIYNIAQREELEIKDITFGNNRANNMGEGLEAFIKDSFANMFDEPDKNLRNIKYKQVFSFQGSKRNPPDLMLKSGPAIEVKKIESLTTELQLNSSHPKQVLKSDSSFITKKCVECEEWTEKEFIYVIGHIPKNTNRLSSLWFVYGDIYAASEETYISLKNDIATTIDEIPDIEFSETNEIGRVNKVDPLGITNLRIRGMWLLQPPFKVFDYIHNYEPGKRFQCFALIPLTKYNNFPESSINRLAETEGVTISDVNVNDPDNPVALIECKLIEFKVEPAA
ncbi:NgoPII family restriction endonuclease [Seonamhaeicola algicola]|uniref:NgoPII family restriction endonuclease n=1 Tax=Seonamhaeicola algicola TaxID=1719036 RepID=A0A5C7AK03_9FLAO|nr:NgoPII family restriction endonuclease [Seonamhaeicola algicola]TXE08119.1 NgoPII family restriction endonuclease [Seonamhaeicola algicola]